MSHEAVRRIFSESPALHRYLFVDVSHHSPRGTLLSVLSFIIYRELINLRFVAMSYLDTSFNIHVKGTIFHNFQHRYLEIIIKVYTPLPFVRLLALHGSGTCREPRSHRLSLYAYNFSQLSL